MLACMRQSFLHNDDDEDANQGEFHFFLHDYARSTRTRMYRYHIRVDTSCETEQLARWFSHCLIAAAAAIGDKFVKD